MGDSLSRHNSRANPFTNREYLDNASSVLFFIDCTPSFPIIPVKRQERHVKRHRVVTALLAAMMLLCAACASEPGIEKGKFSESLRIARDLQTSLTRGDSCDVPVELLQKLASETETLKNRTASAAEKNVLRDLLSLVSTYHDGVLLCKSRNRLSQFPFVPRGRIYVFQELDPLVQKYGLPTESHVYGPTGATWRSISSESIREIWERAGAQLRNIENAVNYS